MPNLQDHMLRVAGVASLICDSFDKPVNKEIIINALLVHDIGNMSKVKLDRFPEFAQPQGIEYWQKIVNEFKEKYGNNDYDATYKILNELNLSNDITELVKSIEFAKTVENSKHNDFNKKICLYSDIRVAPFGVTSLNERLNEVKDRYIENKGVTKEFFSSLVNGINVIEKQIFEYCKIIPEEISEEKVKSLFKDLKNFEIKTG